MNTTVAAMQNDVLQTSLDTKAGPQMMLIGSLVLAAVLFRLYKWWKTVYTPRPPDSTPFEAIQIVIERLDAYFGSDNQWETFFTWTNAILHFRGLRAHFDLERGIHVDDLPRSRNPHAIVFVVPQLRTSQGASSTSANYDHPD